MTLQTAITYVDIATASLCLFCFSQLVMRRGSNGAYVPLALLFLFQGILITSMVMLGTDTPTRADIPLMRLTIVTGVLSIPGPFLFWLYVRALTSESENDRPVRLRNHIIPIATVSVMLSLFIVLPADVLLGEADLSEAWGAALVGIAMLAFVGDIAFQVMIAVYLILVIRRLRAYRRRLRDVFASTEDRELGWVRAITVAALVFWVINCATSVVIWTEAIGRREGTDLVALMGSVALLALFWVIGIWGLRQRPGLQPDPAFTGSDAPGEAPGATVQKYEKSALDPERAARIARKIEAVMAQDKMYREPNLSLWDLSQKIGVTSHYVSQTLNTILGSNFFDYVNRWRIQDAVQQLRSSNQTILMIAYDVGFNSRSAFYKAFKRETGKTPSDLRG